MIYHVLFTAIFQQTYIADVKLDWHTNFLTSVPACDRKFFLNRQRHHTPLIVSCWMAHMQGIHLMSRCQTGMQLERDAFM